MADSHTCILLDNGVVKCAGYGLDGRLGYGDKVHHGIPEVGDALPTIDLGTGRTAKRFIVGGNHHCALLDDDTIKCWGLNGGGQLGLGDTATRGDELTDMGDLLPTLDLGTGAGAPGLDRQQLPHLRHLHQRSAQVLGEQQHRHAGPGPLQ
jgi:E3 ubiquitin-protein ligase HERC3